jgi:transposase
MDRSTLAAQLASGQSIEAIARELGRDPSTVAYWVNKHGLVSLHAQKHAARGGISRERLEPLVEAGLSVRAIAQRLDVSYATVQHWLRKHGLETAHARRRRLTPRPHKDGPATLEGACEVHGPSVFVRRADGYYRCIACRSAAVVKRRRAVKQILVDEAGGACRICGYDRFPAALQFHHSIRARRLSACRVVASPSLSRPLATRRPNACCSARTATRRSRRDTDGWTPRRATAPRGGFEPPRTD